jgi:hypothetical protein
MISFFHLEFLQTRVIVVGKEKKGKKIWNLLCFFEKEKNHILEKLIV